MRSPLNYLGGKSLLAGTIVPLIPEDHVCYCEPFCGAAWVFFTKAPSKLEVINDRDCELVTFWRVIQHHLEEFLRYFKYAVVSRRIFELENKKDPSTLTDIQRAVRYFYIQRLAFGGKPVDRTFGATMTRPTGLNISTVEETLLDVHWRLERVTIECLDAIECVTRYDRPTTFFYLDPPYYETVGYAVPWGPADFERLRDRLQGIQGRFILSLNDVPAVRDMFKAFHVRRVSTKYSLANGAKSNNGRTEPRSEVLISNFDTRALPPRTPKDAE